jgi:23S rRNA (pseudouridine1915-N3)-methyltransferase
VLTSYTMAPEVGADPERTGLYQYNRGAGRPGTRFATRGRKYTEPMKLWIAAVGARPRETFDDLARLYLDRMGPLLPGSGPSSRGSKSNVGAPVFRSEDTLWEAVERERARTAPMLVLLDQRGKQMTSATFARWLGRERDEGRQLIVFAIGPADGWSEASRKRAASLLSLGPMTLAHELARVVLCEQIYRALTILAGHPYHRSGSQ